MFNNKIWNRNFLDWLILTMGVVNLIIGIQILSYLSYLNMIMAGLCIADFIFVGLINKQIDDLNKIYKSIDEAIQNSKNKKIIKTTKRKGGEKK